jgi:probable rRNA maturation factor
VITVQIANEQTSLRVDDARLREAVRAVVEEASIHQAEISVAVVDDAAIQELNRRYLRHDEPTDVLSFLLERAQDRLEGEIVVSADTARRTAPRFGWSAADELLFYVVHGTLHLVGYDDQTPGDRARMRARERECLARFGVEPSEEIDD